MFCKKCGKAIKDNAAFCPFCGEAVRKPTAAQEFKGVNNLTTSFLTENKQEKAHDKHVSVNWKAIDKRSLLLAVSGIVIFVFFAGLITLLSKKPWERHDEDEEIEYSVVGEWTCEDFSEVGACLADLVTEEAGYMAGEFVEELWSETVGAVTFTVTESGKIRIGAHDVSVSVGEITYEFISSDRIILEYTVDIPFLGNSVTISYNADYHVKAHEMTLDCFGAEITLERAE